MSGRTRRRRAHNSLGSRAGMAAWLQVTSQSVLAISRLSKDWLTNVDDKATTPARRVLFHPRLCKLGTSEHLNHWHKDTTQDLVDLLVGYRQNLSDSAHRRFCNPPNFRTVPQYGASVSVSNCRNKTGFLRRIEEATVSLRTVFFESLALGDALGTGVTAQVLCGVRGRLSMASSRVAWKAAFPCEGRGRSVSPQGGLSQQTQAASNTVPAGDSRPPPADHGWGHSGKGHDPASRRQARTLPSKSVTENSEVSSR